MAEFKLIFGGILYEGIYREGIVLYWIWNGECVFIAGCTSRYQRKSRMETHLEVCRSFGVRCTRTDDEAGIQKLQMQK